MDLRAPTVAADQAARTAAQTQFDAPLLLVAGAGTGKTAALVSRIAAWTLGVGWQRAAEEEQGDGARARPEGSTLADRRAARVLDGVVAVTFTEAAAAEMASRVGEVLASLAAGEWDGFLDRGAFPDGDDVAERAKALLGSLGHLQVTTIHSFCRKLLAAWPLEAALHPGFTVDAEGYALDAAVRGAVEERLRAAGAGGAEEDLLALAACGHGPVAIAEAVKAMVEAGVPPSAFVGDPFGPQEIGRLLGGVRAALAAFAAAGGESLAAVTRGSITRETIDALADVRRWVESVDGADLAGLDAFCETVRSGIDPRAWKRMGEWAAGRFVASEGEALGARREAVATAAGALRRSLDRCRRLRPLLLTHARKVVGPLVDAATKTMRVEGAETFHALLEDARRLLVEHPRIAEIERRRIRQLLIDEFQDTDTIQCDIIRALALAGEPEQRPGLFVVGDPKQSIYGWRSADLAAFEGFVADLRRAGGEVMSLVVNFRSVPAILEEVERCMAPVMVEEAGVQPRFEPLVPWRSAGDAAETGCAVEFWVAWERQPGGAPGPMRFGPAAEMEARAVAGDLRRRHDAEGLGWRDAAILLRSLADVETYLEALRGEGVPYLVERDSSYYRRREVIDAASLVRAILDPADHLALVGWLRSVSVGVPDAAWVPLWGRRFPELASALGKGDEAVAAALRDAVAAAAAEVPADVPGIERIRGWEHSLLAALEDLEALRASFAADPVTVFVEKLRMRTMIEASEAGRYLGRFRVANLERFFAFLLDALERSAGSPEAVLRGIRTALAEERESEEGRPREASEDAVRVMTVHRAKGLDFSHVYLVQVNKGMPARDDSRNDAARLGGEWMYRILDAPVPGWEQVDERRQRVREAELVRATYVALTRAKDRLVVAGVWPADVGDGAPRSVAEVVRRRRGQPDLAKLFAACEAGGSDHVDAGGVRWFFPALAAREERRVAPAPQVRHRAADAAMAAAAGLAARRREAARRMTRPFGSAASSEAHRLLENAIAEGGGRTEMWSAAVPQPGRGIAAAVGSAFHACMEALDTGKPIADAVADLDQVLDARLEATLSGGEVAAARERGRGLLRRLAASALGRRLEAIAGGVVARELPIVLPPGPEDEAVGFVAGAIDLVYRDPADGAFVVVDFKTDDVADGEELLERARVYRSQGEIYVRAVAEALELSGPPRCEFWFVGPGRIVALEELGGPTAAEEG